MGRKVIRIFAFLLLLVGAGVFLYPAATKYLAEYQSEKTIEEFYAETGSGKAKENSQNDTAEQGNSDKNAGTEKKADTEETNIKETDIREDGIGGSAPWDNQISAAGLEEMRRDLQAYNERIYAEGQSGLQDPFDYETPSFDLTQYGLSQNIIGILWIPRMEVELPVYLGANQETMAKGAGLLGQTSMPLGGENTNVVLAAHRGWRGIPMFRNIQSLQMGDKIEITTPWETLVYRVCELKIILPGDSDEILIREGRDLVTLLTCHPYTQNYQRYLVVAERSFEEPSGRESDLEEAAASYSDEPRTVEVIGADGGTEEIAVDPSSIQPSAAEGSEAGAAYSNLQIWMEDCGVWIGFGIVILLIVLMFLTGKKKKQAEERKRQAKERKKQAEKQ